MLELYHWEPNIFFLKPLIALAEKGVSYRAHYYDALQFEQFAPGFPSNVEASLQLEREGPLLVHDGEIISSSFFQLEYIAEAFDGPSLLPSEPFDRYRAHAWGQIFALAVGSAVATLGCARYLTPQLQARPPETLRAQIAAIEPLERRAAWSAALQGFEPRVLQAAEQQLANTLRRVEARLASSPWLAGAHYSIADIDAFAMLRPLPALVPAVLEARNCPRILEFLQLMEQRPAVRSALGCARTPRPAEAFVPGPEASRWG